MARGACTFKQLDVTRAIRAAVAAGIEVRRFEIDKDGKITVEAKRATDAEPAAEDHGPNEWEGAT